LLNGSVIPPSTEELHGEREREREKENERVRERETEREREMFEEVV